MSPNLTYDVTILVGCHGSIQGQVVFPHCFTSLTNCFSKFLCRQFCEDLERQILNHLKVDYNSHKEKKNILKESF